MDKEIKICGTQSILDLETAVTAGATAVGIICDRTRITRDTVNLHRADWFVRSTPNDVTSVLVPRLTEPGDLVDLAKRVRPDRIQLGENEDPRLAEALFNLEDRPEIAQVFHISDHTTPAVMDDFMDFIDYTHFDTFSEDRPGGTGQTHDLEVSREMTEAAHEAGKLALLAGGLTWRNVARAIQIVRPNGVDVQTGIKDRYRSHDRELVVKFVEAASTAFQAIEVVS